MKKRTPSPNTFTSTVHPHCAASSSPLGTSLDARAELARCSREQSYRRDAELLSQNFAKPGTDFTLSWARARSPNIVLSSNTSATAERKPREKGPDRKALSMHPVCVKWPLVSLTSAKTLKVAFVKSLYCGERSILSRHALARSRFALDRFW